MSIYDSIAKYYDLVQKHIEDYQAEAKRMHAIFQAHGVKSVFDMACGTGSHVLKLTKLGYRCVGSDISLEMLAMARKKAEEARLAIQFVQGDMRNYELAEKFDAVISLYSLTSVMTNNEFEACLQSAHRALREDGVFYLNLINAEFEAPVPPMPGPPLPAMFIDVVVQEANTKLVRLNKTIIGKDVQDWVAIYLIDEGSVLQMYIDQQKLRLRRLDEVKKSLERQGFQFETVAYFDIQSLQKWDMFITATAQRLV